MEAELETGKPRILFLFDGLDEAPTDEQRAFISAAVRAFASAHPDARIAITCRTWTYEHQREDGESWKLPGFVECRLADLDTGKQKRFIDAWYAEQARLLAVLPDADDEANAAELNDFEQDDLYNPNQAILIGSQYMKNLFDELKHPANVAAAYNGSEQSVRRWVARSKSTDVDRHVIEVGKRETKDYVYKVMNNLWAYQALYR